MADAAAAAYGGSLAGTVKSWNGTKGYGFLTCEAFPGVDVMFGRNELPPDHREVQGTFLQGRAIMFDAAEMPDGRFKATSVAVAAEEGKPLAGAVKSFSERNGYGFITSSTLGEDVRFNATDLPAVQAMAGASLVGVLVTFGTQARPDGKLMARNLMFQSAQIAEKVASAAGAIFSRGCMGAAMGGKGCGGVGGKGCGGGMPRQMASSPASGLVMTGVVKSFSDKNGYGFINIPGQQVDLKFGRHDLQGAAGPIAAGTAVSFTLAAGPDGRIQAKQVSPAHGGTKRLGDASQAVYSGGGHFGGGKGFSDGRALKQPRVLAPQPQDGGQVAKGVVKSYNAVKGFGFIAGPGLSGDAYFARAALVPEVQGAESLQGQSVAFTIDYTADGKLRAQNVTLA